MIQYLAELDHDDKDRENEGEMERIMFATNPEWWKHMYMDPNADEKGEVIRTPATKDEFREMAEEWGLNPDELGL